MIIEIVEFAVIGYLFTNGAKFWYDRLKPNKKKNRDGYKAVAVNPAMVPPEHDTSVAVTA